MKDRIRSHTELEVYKRGFDASMKIFETSKSFPKKERYSLTDQIRQSSRSVCANLAEAWRKRRHEAHFISKLSDSGAEAAGTQVWIQFAVSCEYLDRGTAAELFRASDKTIGTIVGMINDPEIWTITKGS